MNTNLNKKGTKATKKGGEQTRILNPEGSGLRKLSKAAEAAEKTTNEDGFWAGE